MSLAHSTTMPCTMHEQCINTSCNQPKVVPEPEIPAPRDKEKQRGVGDIHADCSMKLAQL